MSKAERDVHAVTSLFLVVALLVLSSPARANDQAVFRRGQTLTIHCAHVEALPELTAMLLQGPHWLIA